VLAVVVYRLPAPSTPATLRCFLDVAPRPAFLNGKGDPAKGAAVDPRRWIAQIVGLIAIELEWMAATGAIRSHYDFSSRHTVQRQPFAVWLWILRPLPLVLSWY